MERRFSVSVDPIVFAEKVAMDAELLLLMLGARTTVTPFHHQPEAQHPKIFQLSTSRRPITPSLGHKQTFRRLLDMI
jgi:hypothetical protein